MTRRTKASPGKGAVELMEEAVHLVRTAPARVLAAYCVGSLPCFLALLYFWADMSQRAGAATRCGEWALLVAASFVWMKCWHAVYAAGLRRHLLGRLGPPWTLRRAARVFVNQGGIQPTGLLMIPLALLAMLPLAWVYAFYQNVCVLDEGEEGRLRDLMARAWAQAKPWPNQNHIVIWLLSPMLLIVAVVFVLAILPVAQVFVPQWGGVFLSFYAFLIVVTVMALSPLGVILLLNFRVLVALIPALLNVLFGIDSVFARAGPTALLNTTLTALACGLAYLCMDPFLKAAYVLRCFYGESLDTGEDLKAELHAFDAGAVPPPSSHTVVGVLLVLTVVLGISGRAAATDSMQSDGLAPVRSIWHTEETLFLLGNTPEHEISSSTTAGEAWGNDLRARPTRVRSVVPEILDRSIAQVLQQREYSWRMPRSAILSDESEPGIIGRFLRRFASMLRQGLNALDDWIGRFIEWFVNLFPRAQRGRSDGWLDWRTMLRLIGYTLIAALALAIGVVVFRIWLRSRVEEVRAVPETLSPAPDLEDERTGAAELPEEGWLAMARELAARGETRLALRALFLALLARLAALDLITLARFKSNRDYLRELDRHSHAQPELLGAFQHCTALFERVWYGRHEATPEMVDGFSVYHERVRACEQEQ